MLSLAAVTPAAAAPAIVAGVTAVPDQTFTTPGVAPGAATAAADAITATSARLHASVDPRNDAAATYRFEWGPTTAYGQAVADAPVPGAIDPGSREVWVDLAGLEPATLYHFRVVATSASGATPGQDAWFTTAAAPATTTTTDGGGTSTTTDGGGTSTTTDGGGTSTTMTPPAPQLGRTAVADVVQGTVRIRRPGTSSSVPLTDATAIPTGSVVDALSGTLTLDTALNAGGRQQTAQFRGAVFRIGLAKSGGMVDLTLTQRATGCAKRAASRARVRAVATAAAKKRKRQPSLWGKDSKGKYRTHGRNSVATVRGTEWTTTETCTGTLTRVVKGAVAVRDVHTRKTHLVRAGHSYLARNRR